MATRDGRHRPHRRAGDGLRLSRRHHGDDRVLARGVAWRLDAGTRRAVRRAARGRPRHRVVRRCRRQAARRGPRAGPRHRRPALHQRRDPRARERRTTRPSQTAARSAGALVVADEVQAGFGRAGDHLWSFVGAGLSPDIVTLGKPMGNGYPIAAVVTRRSYVEALGARGGVLQHLRRQSRRRPSPPSPCSTSSTTTTWSPTRPPWGRCCATG